MLRAAPSCGGRDGQRAVLGLAMVLMLGTVAAPSLAASGASPAINLEAVGPVRGDLLAGGLALAPVSAVPALTTAGATPDTAGGPPEVSGTTVAEVDEIRVAGRTLIVPRPADFVRPAARLQARYEALGLGAAGGRDPLLLLVPQALEDALTLQAAVEVAHRSLADDAQRVGVPANGWPQAEEEPVLNRYLVIKVPAVPRLQQMSAAEFAVFCRHVQEDHQRLLQAQRPWPGGWHKPAGSALLVGAAQPARNAVPADTTQTVGSRPGMAAGATSEVRPGAGAIRSAGRQPAGSVPPDGEVGRGAPLSGRWLLPVHAVDGQGLAYSAFNVLGRHRDGTPRLQAQTLAMLHLGGRLLFVQVNGGADDLAWTQALMQRWVDAIRQRNPGREPSGTTTAETAQAAQADAVQRAVRAASNVVATLVDPLGEAPASAPRPDTPEGGLDAALARAVADAADSANGMMSLFDLPPPAEDEQAWAARAAASRTAAAQAASTGALPGAAGQVSGGVPSPAAQPGGSPAGPAVVLPDQDLAPPALLPSERLTETVVGRLLAALACAMLLWCWVQLRASRRTQP